VKKCSRFCFLGIDAFLDKSFISIRPDGHRKAMLNANIISSCCMTGYLTPNEIVVLKGFPGCSWEERSSAQKWPQVYSPQRKSFIGRWGFDWKMTVLMYSVKMWSSSSPS